ncbi:10007_t:CDS:1, partial [Entrophospora sp. SA101]
RFSSVDWTQLLAGLIKCPLLLASRAFCTLFNCNPNTRGPEIVAFVPVNQSKPENCVVR